MRNICRFTHRNRKSVFFSMSAFMLIFLLFIQPCAQVFADDVTPSVVPDSGTQSTSAIPDNTTIDAVSADSVTSSPVVTNVTTDPIVSSQDQATVTAPVIQATPDSTLNTSSDA